MLKIEIAGIPREEAPEKVLRLGLIRSRGHNVQLVALDEYGGILPGGHLLEFFFFFFFFPDGKFHRMYGVSSEIGVQTKKDGRWKSDE